MDIYIMLRKIIPTFKEIIMKHSLLAAALIALGITACGDPKPGQYPPGFMDERESAIDDNELEAIQQETTVIAEDVDDENQSDDTDDGDSDIDSEDNETYDDDEADDTDD